MVFGALIPRKLDSLIHYKKKKTIRELKLEKRNKVLAR